MIKKYLVFPLVLFLLPSVAYATPLRIPDMLCIDPNSINYSSPDFQILRAMESNKSFIIDEVDCIFRDMFERPNQIYYRGTAKRIKILIDDNELINTELAPLITTANLVAESQTEKVVVYECPWHLGQTIQEANACPLLFNLNKYSQDLSIYDGKSFKIFMDNNLARDYKMSFRKGDIKPNSNYRTNFISQIFAYITSLFTKSNFKF